MDLSTIVYIILIVGWFIFSILKTFNKEEVKRQTPKSRKTVTMEEDGPMEQPKEKKKQPASPIFQEATGENEYFSYETMSERDFEQAFSENMEENKHFATAAETPHPDIHLNLDEEEVYKGVVWSEILKRKYS